MDDSLNNFGLGKKKAGGGGKAENDISRAFNIHIHPHWNPAVELSEPFRGNERTLCVETLMSKKRGGSISSDFFSPARASSANI